MNYKISKNVLILCIIVFCMFFIGCKETTSTNEYLKSTWNIDISEESTILYELDTFGGFNGDGFDYIIYELESSDLESLINNDFLHKTNLYTEYTSFLEYYIERVKYIYRETHGFNIPLEFQLNENINIKNYYWKYIVHSGSVELFALIDTDSNLLYIYISKQ